MTSNGNPFRFESNCRDRRGRHQIVLVLNAGEHHFRSRHICLGIVQNFWMSPVSDQTGKIGECAELIARRFPSVESAPQLAGSRRNAASHYSNLPPCILTSLPAQPGTWVTLLTDDMGNTFLVLFRSSCCCFWACGHVVNAQRCPHVHRSAVSACAGGYPHEQ